MRLRELQRSDRGALEALIRGTDAFREDEVAVALELIDAGLDTRSGYLFSVAAADDDSPLGYACWGLTPLTDGVYDLYWIVVDAARQRTGVGRALLDAVLRDARDRGGRWIVIETSGKASYASQRAFYERCGCSLLARYPDFYRAGDDLITMFFRV